MKHFFFNNEVDMSWDTLINCYVTPGNDYDRDRLAETQDIIQIFKHIYDAADIIYDRRVDPDLSTINRDHNGELTIEDNGDDLLRFFLKSFDKATLAERIKSVGSNKSIVQKVYDSIKQDMGSQESTAGEVISFPSDATTRAQAGVSQVFSNRNLPGLMLTKTLLCLWNYTADLWKLYTNGGRQRESRSDVYFYLTAGNIARRISQRYYTTDRNFVEAEEWGKKAIEMIWHGKNCCEKGRGNYTNDEERELLRLLLDYNTGTHYLDYAKRNRRSNNDSAERCFEDVNNFFYEGEKAFSYVEKLKKKTRQQRYLQLYIESLRHLIIVDQRRNGSKALGAAKAFYYSTHQEPSGFFDGDSQEANDLVLQKARQETAVLNVLGYIGPEGEQTVNHMRIVLLSTLDYARCLYDSNRYNDAILYAFEAIVLSKKIDAKVFQQKEDVFHCNVDGLLIISKAMRKLCIHMKEKVFKDNDSFINRDRLFKIVDPKNKYQQSIYQIFKREFKKKIKGGVFNELKYYANAQHLDSKCELIKWHCLYMETPVFRDTVDKRQIAVKKEYFFNGFPSDQSIIDRYLQGVEDNLKLCFYRGMMQHHRGAFEDAVRTLTSVLVNFPIQTNYIRPKTIGLKIRYLLANAYMKLGRFAEAKTILCDLYDTLIAVEGLSNKVRENNPYVDERIIVDLAYCYNHEGNYRKAFKLYTKYAHDRFMSKEDKYEIRGYNPNKKKHAVKVKRQEIGALVSGVKEHNDLFLQTLKEFPRKAGFNNLLRCCIFLSKDPAMVDYHEDINQLINVIIESDYTTNDDCEKALLRGYLCVLSDKDDKAKHFFEVACQKNAGYVGKFSFENMEGDQDEGARINRVEYISAYIIHLAKAAKTKTTQTEAEKEEVYQFIQFMTAGFQISLKAAIELAEWIVLYDGRDKEYLSNLCRSFGYVDIYKERGAAAFNQLRSNPSFRLLRPEYRGFVLAHLLSLYRHINTIKEYATFNLEDKRRANNSGMHLVHYTNLNNLKRMLEGDLFEDTPDDALRLPDSSLLQGVKAKKPRKRARFRISNSGYVNDISEGRVFIDCVKESWKPLHGDKQQFGSICKKYFPQLQRSFANMNPTGSTVYTASLSVKNDSFPMWKIYAADENGCNIEFEEDFFDIKGIPYYAERLMDYLPSPYTDDDYPLYNVQYIRSKFYENELEDDYKSKYDRMADRLMRYIEYRVSHSDSKQDDESASLAELYSLNRDSIKNYVAQCLSFRGDYVLDRGIDPARSVRFVKQECGTRALRYSQLKKWLNQLMKSWKSLEDVLSLGDAVSNTDNDAEEAESFKRSCTLAINGNDEAKKAIRNFAADRINEVRFLFKDSDYEFEGEVRLVYNDNPNESRNQESYASEIPHEYIRLNRDLKNLTVTLGSKIIDIDVDKIVTWLYKSKYVNQVKLAKRNRYDVEYDSNSQQ